MGSFVPYHLVISEIQIGRLNPTAAVVGPPNNRGWRSDRPEKAHFQKHLTRLVASLLFLPDDRLSLHRTAVTPLKMVYIMEMWCDGGCSNNGRSNPNLPVLGGAGVYFPRALDTTLQRQSFLLPSIELDQGDATATNNSAPMFSWAGSSFTVGVHRRTRLILVASPYRRLT